MTKKFHNSCFAVITSANVGSFGMKRFAGKKLNFLDFLISRPSAVYARFAGDNDKK